ncbi:hypothetical protein D3C73_773610 [compost metagenome]
MHEDSLGHSQCCEISDQQGNNQIQRHNNGAQQHDQNDENTAEHQYYCARIILIGYFLQVAVGAGHPANGRFRIFQLRAFHGTVHRCLDIPHTVDCLCAVRIGSEDHIQSHHLAVRRQIIIEYLLDSVLFKSLFRHQKPAQLIILGILNLLEVILCGIQPACDLLQAVGTVAKTIRQLADLSGKLSKPVCELLLSTLQLIQTAGNSRNLIYDLSLSGSRLIQSRLQLANARYQLVEALRQCRLARCRFGIACIGFVKARCGTFQLPGNLPQSASQLRRP